MPCNETLIIWGRIYYNKGGKAIKRDAAEKAQKPKARNGARGPRASNPLRSSCLRFRPLSFPSIRVACGDKNARFKGLVHHVSF